MTPAIRIAAIEALPDDYLTCGDFGFTIRSYARQPGRQLANPAGGAIS